MTARGDVVIVQFPYQDGTRGKNRPALVVQCDENNRRLQNILQSHILRTIGHLSPALMAKVDARLKASLGLK